MDKQKLLILGGAVVLVVGAMMFLTTRQSEPESPPVSSETRASSAPNPSSSSTFQTSESQTTTSEQTRETTEVVALFSEHWLNYTDIYERNQSVIDLVTPDCREENQLDVNPNVAYIATATIKTVTQDVSDSTHFVVLAEQEMSGYTNDVVLELRVSTDSKISEIIQYDVRTGY